MKRKTQRIIMITSLILIGGIFMLTNSCKKDDTSKTPATTTVTDVEGNVYKTITIGTQIWMAENLKTTKYRNGDTIANVTDNTQWSGLSTGAYCTYNNSAANGSVYGKLYNWYAVTDSRKIAPLGWHVPSYAEWETLVNLLGGKNSAGGKLKEVGLVHWAEFNLGATNSSGFTGLAGGYRGSNGLFYYLKTAGDFWVTTEYGGGDAFYFSLGDLSNGVWIDNIEKETGNSLRCIKD